MPVDVRRASNDSESIEAAITAFETDVSPTSIDHVDITPEQRTMGKVTIAIVYTV